MPEPVPPVPESWEIQPKEYLGRDTRGRDYWRVVHILGDENQPIAKDDSVLRYKDGFTTWVCQYVAWPQAMRIYDVVRYEGA